MGCIEDTDTPRVLLDPKATVYYCAHKPGWVESDLPPLAFFFVTMKTK